MRIFVTGGHGFLGGYLLPLLRDRGHEVIAPQEYEFDITSTDPLRFINKNQFCDFGMIINLAAYTDVPGAEKNPKEALRVNSAVSWLAHVPYNCQIFHMSTDYVYDGDTPYSKETDMRKPFNKYGVSKALADSILLAYCHSNLHIIRTSFKPLVWPYKAAFTDMRTNADTVDIMAEMFTTFMLSDPPGGVWNIGTEPKTVYDLARRHNPEVQECSMRDIPYLKPDVTMDLTKYHNWIGATHE